MQLLHLEGPTDKESRLTAIPREKSRTNFVVQRGGNLYADGVSLVDTLPPDNNDTGDGEGQLGEIIFEAGMDRITLSGSLRSELNQDFFQNHQQLQQQQQKSVPQSQQQPRSSSTSNNDHNGFEGSTNNGGVVKQQQRHQSNSGSIRRNSKKDRSPSSTTTTTAPQPLPLSSSKGAVNDEYEMDEVDNVFDANDDEPSTTDGKSIPMRVLHHHTNNKPPYKPLGSDSTMSSATGYAAAQKSASTRKGYVALDIDPGEAADTSDVDDDDYDEETPSSLFSGSDYTTYRGGGDETSRRSSSANTNTRSGSNAQHQQKSKGKDNNTGGNRNIKDSIVKKTGTGGVNVGKVRWSPSSLTSSLLPLIAVKTL